MSARNLITVVLIVAAAVLGFFFGAAVAGSKTTSPAAPSAGSRSTPARNPIFKSQTAVFQGVISGVSGNNLVVKDDQGQTATFPVSAKVVIYKFTAGSRQASASSDLRSIDTGKQVLVMLELTGNRYEVSSVSYLPPPPQLKP